MKISSDNCLLITLLVFSFVAININVEASQLITCSKKNSPCFLKKMPCPVECPSTTPKDPKTKACYVDCQSPICKAACKKDKPVCHGPGAACKDPRFIGGDGRVFYFHGKKNEYFSLVSDANLQINACFIGLRPVGRPRDSTWIQALGVLFGSHNVSIEATKASSWNDEADHLKFSYDGNDISVPVGYPSYWRSEESKLKIRRTSSQNSVLVTIADDAEIAINVVPVTKEDDRIHNYQIPSDDCFAHLEVQFRFFSLSSNVEGVIGRTYQPDFKNPAKPGVAMPVVGGEDKYKTTSLFSADCKHCLFNPINHIEAEDEVLVMDYGALDCSGSVSSGNGIVCRN